MNNRQKIQENRQQWFILCSIIILAISFVSILITTYSLFTIISISEKIDAIPHHQCWNETVGFKQKIIEGTYRQVNEHTAEYYFEYVPKIAEVCGVK